jgi:alkylhydroperoxidase family enzyme
MDAVLADWQTAVIPEKSRAALRLLECLTLRPMALDESFVQALRDDGLDDPAMREAGNTSFHFNMLNRLSDAFDFEVLNAKQEALHTKMLNQAGKRLKGIQADPVWTRDEDGQIRPTELSRARQPLLNAPGKTSSELRQAVEAFVAIQRGQSRPQTSPVPDELTSYLQKLALTAYKITDKNFNDLRLAGYEDEAIYEITVTGAFGAALVGVEKLFDVLYG